MGSMAQPDQQVAIVTGASSGIGLWVAGHLHAQGFLVALCGRREKEGQEAATALDAKEESAIFVQCDVKSYQSQVGLFKRVWAKWGRIDLVVPNAGCVDRGSVYDFSRRAVAVHDTPPEPNLDCTDIDLKGTMFSTRLAIHYMRHNPDRKGGKIIVTGSMLGIYPCQTFPEYCAAKAAIHQLVKTLGPILKIKENLTINCVMPGGIETAAMPGFSKAFLPEQMTLRSTLLSGYDVFVQEKENIRTGETLEAAHDKLVDWGHPGYKSGAFAKRTEAVFEPWFKMLHGENSDLPDAIQDWPDHRPKTIAVIGATGSQGGGVVNVMKKTPGWKVRALTRNPESEAAKKLAADGVVVVRADFDDYTSLADAFKGTHAIFAVTNWWEHLFGGKSQDEAGVIEEEQGMNIARAAAATSSLRHFIWSTTPSAKKMFAGKLRAPHMDYKANVDARIKAELPKLAAITSYLYFGYYPQNMAFFPLCKPVFHPDSGQYIQAIPSKPDAKVLVAGDMTVNPGIWVRQIIASGDKAYGKYANVALEKLTFQEMVDIWSDVTGKKCVFTEISADAATKLFGDAGSELAMQFKFGEECDPWVVTEEHLSPSELGIDETEVVGCRGTLEGLKRMGFWA